MLENIHAFCAEVIRLSGEYPEATVAVWVTSAFLTLTQLTLLLKRLTFSKKVNSDDDEEGEEVDVITVPYIPGDTVIKLVKLMEKQESGWKIAESTVPSFIGHTPSVTLWYGSNLSITKTSGGRIEVAHKSVDVPLTKNSKRPELDQTLLLNAFTARTRSERAKIRKQNEQYALQAEDHANRELTNILDTI